MVTELTHVAGPGIRAKRPKHLVVHSLDRAIVLAVQVADQPLDEVFQVFEAFAQGRHANLHNIETVIEVAA